MSKLGRPFIEGKESPQLRRVVYLSDTLYAIARELGDGNPSEGLRRALMLAEEQLDDTPH